MHTIHKEIGLEEFRSRVCGLFAYIDEDGVLHNATDSVDGCYGKIVENLKVPDYVSLYTYVEILPANAPTEGYFESQPSLTYRIGAEIPEYTDAGGEKFIRQSVAYRYEASEEGEHDYTEVDLLPDYVDDDSEMYVSTPYIDAYGHMVTNCRRYYTKVGTYRYYIKKEVIHGGKTYSYRTLITYYNRFREVAPDNMFIQFMSDGIGRVDVDRKFLGLTDALYTNVPSVIYLAEVKDLYNQYKQMSDACESYLIQNKVSGEINSDRCCQCDMYQRMGGDVFKSWLLSLFDRRQEIADAYYCYATLRDYDVSLRMSVALFDTYKDSGVLSAAVNEFIGGERYMHGEILTYDGRSYISLLDTTEYGHTYPFIKKNGKYFMYITGMYIEIHIEACTALSLPSSMYNHSEFIHYNNEYYRFNRDTNEYEIIEVTEYNCGLWNAETRRMEFDPYHFKLISEYYKENGGANTEQSEGWYSEATLYGDKMRTYHRYNAVPTSYINEIVRVGDVIYVWDVDHYVTDPTQGERYTVSGNTDSRLRMLRTKDQFVDGAGYRQLPEEGYDWLWFYRIGFVASYDIMTDDYGNIERYGNEDVHVGDIVTDLYAYGNLILDITYDTDKKEIIFKYVIGGHLTAQCESIRLDDDGNEIYKYKQFKYDPIDPHGMVYEETYTYEDDDIDELIENGDFTQYVSEAREKITNYYLRYSYKKMIMRTDGLIRTVTDTLNGNVVSYNTIESSYNEKMDANMDYMYAPTFKDDVLNGIIHDPNIKHDVKILRGNASAYERFIKLGEVKTIEDLDSYQNGLFFQQTEI